MTTAKLSEEKLAEYREIAEVWQVPHGGEIVRDIFGHIDALTAELAEANDEKEFAEKELAKWKSGYEEAHRRMDAAGIPSAVGAACDDPRCDCHLVHRVHVMLEQLADAKQQLANAKKNPDLDCKCQWCALKGQCHYSAFHCKVAAAMKAAVGDELYEKHYKAVHGDLETQLAAAQQRLASPAVDPAKREEMVKKVREVWYGHPVDDLDNENRSDWLRVIDFLYISGRLSRDAEVAELQRQLAEWRQGAGNLLARIHRDGGHYLGKHGLSKAVEDADKVIVEWLQSHEQLAELRAPADKNNADELVHLAHRVYSERIGQKPDCTKMDSGARGHYKAVVQAVAARVRAPLLQQIAALTEKLAAFEKDRDVTMRVGSEVLESAVELKAERDRLAGELAAIKQALIRMTDERDRTRDMLRQSEASSNAVKQSLAAKEAELAKLRVACDPFRPWLQSSAFASNLGTESFLVGTGGERATFGDVRRLVAALAQPAAEPVVKESLTTEAAAANTEVSEPVCPECGGTEHEPWHPQPTVGKSVRCTTQTAQGKCGLVYDISTQATTSPERKFSCPKCGSKSYYSADYAKGKIGCLHGYAMGCGWSGTWAEVEAAKGEGEEIIECPSCGGSGMRGMNTSEKKLLAKLADANQQLAAAIQAREAAEQNLKATGELLGAVSEEAKQLRQELEEMKQASRQLLERAANAEQRAAAAEASAAAMLETLKAAEYQLLRFDHGFWECNCPALAQDGRLCNKHQLAGKITRTIRAPDAGAKLLAEVLALRKFAKHIKTAHMFVPSISDVLCAVKEGIAELDQALAGQGEQAGEAER